MFNFGKKNEGCADAKKPLKIVNSSLNESMEMGEVFLESGMFTDIKTKAQAVVKILAGKELGLSPLESMTNVYLVNGKVALQAKVIGALVKKSGKYDYQTESLDDKGCTLVFHRIEEGNKRVEIGKSSFSFTDAAKAGLVNKDVWKKYPRNMMFARALSNGTKWFTPDVFCGYTNEEIENIDPPEVPIALEFGKKGDLINKENKTNG